MLACNGTLEVSYSLVLAEVGDHESSVTGCNNNGTSGILQERKSEQVPGEGLINIRV